MPILQVGNMHGVAASSVGNVVLNQNNVATNVNGGTSSFSGLDMDNCDTIAAMDTRLGAIDGTFYNATQSTALRTNTLSYNDKMYAIRLNDFPGTIKQ